MALKLKCAGDTWLAGGERPPDGVEHADVCRRIGTGRTPYGALIDDDHLAASAATCRSAPEGVDESSAASELLPDPATPVKHVSTPFGIRTVRLRRLLDIAFSMRKRVVEGPATAGR